MEGISSTFSLPIIRWADHGEVPAGCDVPSRQIYDHELVYITSGSGCLDLDGRAVAARPDSLFMIPPGRPHSFHADPGRAFRHLGIHFDWFDQHDNLTFPICSSRGPYGPLLRDPRYVPGWNVDSRPRLDLSGRPKVRRLVELVIGEFTSERANYDVARALLVATIAQISREADSLLEVARRTGPDARRRVQRARALLEGEESLSVEQVARSVGWTPDHLRRVFRAAFGTSPVQVRSEARMRQAMELFRTTDLSINEVARRCGYHDPAYFSRLFKAHRALTPTEFLALCRRT